VSGRRPARRRTRIGRPAGVRTAASPRRRAGGRRRTAHQFVSPAKYFAAWRRMSRSVSSSAFSVSTAATCARNCAPAQRRTRSRPIQINSPAAELLHVVLAGRDRGSSRFPGRGRIQRVQDQGSSPGPHDFGVRLGPVTGGGGVRGDDRPWPGGCRPRISLPIDHRAAPQRSGHRLTRLANLIAADPATMRHGSHIPPSSRPPEMMPRPGRQRSMAGGRGRAWLIGGARGAPVWATGWRGHGRAL